MNHRPFKGLVGSVQFAATAFQRATELQVGDPIEMHALGFLFHLGKMTLRVVHRPRRVQTRGMIIRNAKARTRLLVMKDWYTHYITRPGGDLDIAYHRQQLDLVMRWLQCLNNPNVNVDDLMQQETDIPRCMTGRINKFI